LADNPALHYAISQGKKILPVFIYEDHFDSGNEANFERLGAATKLWLHYSLKSFSESISAYGSKLLILKGNQQLVLNMLLEKLKNTIHAGEDHKAINKPTDNKIKEKNVESCSVAIYWNRRYEPHHIKLDTELKKFLTQKNAEIEAPRQYLEMKSFSGNLLIEPWELLNKQSKPYQVYTPFSKQYFHLFESSMTGRIRPLDYKISAENFLSEQIVSEITENTETGIVHQSLESLCSIEDLNLKSDHPWVDKMTRYIKAGEAKAREALEEFIQTNSALNYGEKRNSPFLKGTSQLSTNLHFGEISVRQVYAAVNSLDSSEKEKTVKKYDYLKQLIWREFAHYLMYHFPHTVNQPLREEFKHFNWRSLEEAEDENKNDNANAEIGVSLHAYQMLKKWQQGETGYPIVDAGMKELWETGWMHNRVRMIAASFLVKDLRIHWIEGAKWFWDTLFDADLANNTMGWQWVAGSGADAAPYFRIFNPTTQSERFDPDGVYIKRWLQSLRECSSKDIHAPFTAGALRLTKLDQDYPARLVDHDLERKIALDEFKKLRVKVIL
jgi:deoxyribodipyrimidine photo-lyase